MFQVQGMSLSDRRKVLRLLKVENAKYPKALRQVPRDQWPAGEAERQSTPLIEAWRSNGFVVMVYREPHGVERLSICRALFNEITGEWSEGISWDELQRLKQECGRGDRWAVEAYPPDIDIVNIANMRHLWVLPEKPFFGWERRDGIT